MDLHFDFETRSTADLIKIGVYTYAAHPDTDVWCAAWAFGDTEPQIWHPGLPIPPEIDAHVRAGGTIRAWNANFERVIWREIMTRRYGWPEPALEQYKCVMAMSMAMALPGKLEKAAPALGLQIEKDMAGHRLMMQMCRPRDIRSDGKIIWWDDEDKKQRLYAYCKQDVRTEVAAEKRLVNLNDLEQQIYWLDQRINDRGVTVDVKLCLKARKIIAEAYDRLDPEMARVTDGHVSGTSNVQQLLNWIRSHGIDCTSVDKESIADLLEMDLPPQVEKAIRLRAEAAKTSTSKIDSMIHRVSDDGRMRGNLAYHGAGTGRWAARGTQLQNLIKPEMDAEDVLAAVDDIMAGKSYDYLNMVYEPPLTLIADCIRSMLMSGYKSDLLAADFSQIEARVLAWLAGQEDLVELFRNKGKVYEDMAAAIYDRPVAEIKKPSKERDHGKEAVLGGGFGMGWEKFKGACKKRGIVLSEALAKKTIEVYRAKNDKITAYWKQIEKAAIAAVKKPGTAHSVGPIAFKVKGSFLWCQLPSKRLLCYPYPKIIQKPVPWGGTNEAVTYKGARGFSKNFDTIDTYGAKLVENIVQATARDIMAESMLRIEAQGYKCILTVHDEIIVEAPEDKGDLAEFEKLMAEVPAWAEGCPVATEGWRGKRYRK